MPGESVRMLMTIRRAAAYFANRRGHRHQRLSVVSGRLACPILIRLRNSRDAGQGFHGMSVQGFRGMSVQFVMQGNHGYRGLLSASGGDQEGGPREVVRA